MNTPLQKHHKANQNPTAIKTVLKACVIGWPIKHSRSPLIHGSWLQHYGINGSYAKEAVAPDELKEFLGSLSAKGYCGCNVTLPHKEAVLALADELDGSAIAIGAANTLWLEEGRLCAANTDSVGFMAHLSQSAPGWNNKDGPVSVLGAGGAARAIIYGLIQAGVSEIRLFNRTRATADELVDHFGGPLRRYDWDQRHAASTSSILLINTTSLGMTGSLPLAMDLDAMNSSMVVADIVYAPLQTQLLRDALLRDLVCVDGLGMLLHQAVPGFEKWFGQRPQVTKELRDLIIADLAVS